MDRLRSGNASHDSIWISKLRDAKIWHGKETKRTAGEKIGTELMWNGVERVASELHDKVMNAH